MLMHTQIEAIDYLLIGHLTRDLTPAGDRLGGTVAYAARTAYALGLRVGIITSWGNEFALEPYLGSLPIINVPTEGSTTFENTETPTGRVQIIHQVAANLDYEHIPESWREAPMIHLAPVAQEVAPALVRHFPYSMLVATPQGWLRTWDQTGQVSITEWPEANFILSKMDATILSVEDVAHNEDLIEEMAHTCPVTVVTEGEQGCRVYWNGDVRRFRPEKTQVTDAVGAGDIFSVLFFTRYHKTRDPWEAARFATALATRSVTRAGLESVPTPEEIQLATVEVL